MHGLSSEKFALLLISKFAVAVPETSSKTVIDSRKFQKIILGYTETVPSQVVSVLLYRASQALYAHNSLLNQRCDSPFHSMMSAYNTKQR